MRITKLDYSINLFFNGHTAFFVLFNLFVLLLFYFFAVLKKYIIKYLNICCFMENLFRNTEKINERLYCPNAFNIFSCYCYILSSASPNWEQRSKKSFENMYKITLQFLSFYFFLSFFLSFAFSFFLLLFFILYFFSLFFFLSFFFYGFFSFYAIFKIIAIILSFSRVSFFQACWYFTLSVIVSSIFLIEHNYKTYYYYYYYCGDC